MNTQILRENTKKQAKLQKNFNVEINIKTNHYKKNDIREVWLKKKANQIAYELEYTKPH
jgi:hypothetical protein